MVKGEEKKPSIWKKGRVTRERKQKLGIISGVIITASTPKGPVHQPRGMLNEKLQRL